MYVYSHYACLDIPVLSLYVLTLSVSSLGSSLIIRVPRLYVLSLSLSSSSR